MWKIDKNLKITLTRGDTPSFKLNLFTTDEDGNPKPYTPVDGDEIVFALKKKATDLDLWAKVVIPNDTMILKFEQETTRALDFGDYVYEISLNNADDGYHDTFIANKPIVITEELYNG